MAPVSLYRLFSSAGSVEPEKGETEAACVIEVDVGQIELFIELTT